MQLVMQLMTIYYAAIQQSQIGSCKIILVFLHLFPFIMQYFRFLQ